MEFSFIDSVYLTLTGQLIEECCVPGVENLYGDGSDCARLYIEMWEAYQRLLDRLGRRDDDDDVEIIIDSLLRSCEIVGYGMYRYGAKFGNRENNQ